MRLDQRLQTPWGSRVLPSVVYWIRRCVIRPYMYSYVLKNSTNVIQTRCGLQILCMHGGLSPELKTLEQIKRIPRPTDIPDTGLLCDLLWADPDKEIQGWGENDRGVSYTFGPDSVTEFLQKHDLDLICRAHQAWFLIPPAAIENSQWIIGLDACMLSFFVRVVVLGQCTIWIEVTRNRLDTLYSSIRTVLFKSHPTHYHSTKIT